ncbi:MAG: sigma-70 family RNA polymerase sigma factor [Vicinamibacteria bacterium]|nr:sigma-70 family RNA polymerase sigma factor [Vicinamibacteria bacterium]
MKVYQQRVYATARRIVRRHDLADDVVQEAFIRAFKTLRTFDLDRPFGPWIAKIAIHLALNQLRRPEQRKAQSLEDAPPIAAEDSDPFDSAATNELNAALWQAMAALPEEQRVILHLRASEGLSYDEIAKTLDIAIGTVMSRLSRGRERLRTLLLPYLPSTAPKGRPS